MWTIIQELTLLKRSVEGILVMVFLATFVGASVAQSTAVVENEASKSARGEGLVAANPPPVISIYKDVKIGMDADEVRRLLGKAKIDDSDGFFYDEDSEMIQIRLDETEKVRLIAVTYSSESPNLPKYADIFGADPANEKPDGSVYKLVRYPEAGYWIAYSRTAGDKPNVTVTMQKL